MMLDIYQYLYLRFHYTFFDILLTQIMHIKHQKEVRDAKVQRLFRTWDSRKFCTTS